MNLTANQIGKELQVQRTLLKALLICGILAPLIYIGVDILAASLYEGYSYTDQAISELSAINAPTSWLWNILVFVFNPLIVAFGTGVWFSSDRKRPLNITGILLVIWGILGFIWLLFPMNMRGAIGSASDTGHLILSGVTVLLLTMFIGFGSVAYGKGFRIYSFLTIIIMLVFGALVGIQAPRVAAQLPTPWMGIMERVSVFLPMLWVVVLAIILLHSENEHDSVNAMVLEHKNQE
jgi:hypothetical membrane protein